MGELRQFHPSLNISQIKELSKGDFLIIGDSVQDIIIPRQKCKIKSSQSLPNKKAQTKSLAVKGVPTDITDS